MKVNKTKQTVKTVLPHYSHYTWWTSKRQPDFADGNASLNNSVALERLSFARCPSLMQSGKRVEPTIRPLCLGTNWPSITGINKRWIANRGNKSRVQIVNLGVTLSAVRSAVNVTSWREANSSWSKPVKTWKKRYNLELQKSWKTNKNDNLITHVLYILGNNYKNSEHISQLQCSEFSSIPNIVCIFMSAVSKKFITEKMSYIFSSVSELSHCSLTTEMVQIQE